MAPAEVVLERGSDPLVATVRIERPHVGNSISRETAEQLDAVLDTLSAQPPVGVVVAAAGDRFFCTGGDLEDYRGLHDHASARAVSLRMQEILQRLALLPALVVCAVEGVALGGGTELALAADLRVAGAKATFSLPQSRLGVVPGWGGAPRLAAAVGRGRAVELLVTGRTVGAQEAGALGLVDVVVAAGHAEQTAARIIRGAEASAGVAVRAVKQALDVRTAPEGARLFADLWVGEDHRAAEQAWRSRRRSRSC